MFVNMVNLYIPIIVFLGVLIKLDVHMGRTRRKDIFLHYTLTAESLKLKSVAGVVFESVPHENQSRTVSNGQMPM